MCWVFGFLTHQLDSHCAMEPQCCKCVKVRRKVPNVSKRHKVNHVLHTAALLGKKIWEKTDNLFHMLKTSILWELRLSNFSGHVSLVLWSLSVLALFPTRNTAQLSLQGSTLFCTAQNTISPNTVVLFPCQPFSALDSNWFSLNAHSKLPGHANCTDFHFLRATLQTKSWTHLLVVWKRELFQNVRDLSLTGPLKRRQNGVLSFIHTLLQDCTYTVPGVKNQQWNEGIEHRDLLSFRMRMCKKPVKILSFSVWESCFGRKVYECLLYKSVSFFGCRYVRSWLTWSR